jgi:hypothetical protein
METNFTILPRPLLPNNSNLDEEKESVQNDGIESIPKDIMLNIFNFLKFEDLAKALFVNRRWRKLIDNEEMWRFLCKRDFSYTCIDIDTCVEDQPNPWKLTYQLMNKDSLLYISDSLIDEPSIIRFAIQANKWSLQLQKEGPKSKREADITPFTRPHLGPRDG